MSSSAQKSISAFFALLLNAVLLYAQPGSPSGLTTSTGPRFVNLQWGSVAGTGIYYKLYRGTSSGGKTLLADSLSTTSYRDDSANTGITYYYAVKAFNSSGTSAFSSDVTGYSDNIWYVSNSGSNSANGSSSAPLYSINYALALKIQNGDTLILNPGSYGENINCQNKYFTLASRYILTNDTSYISSTIIDGSLISPSSNTSAVIYWSAVPSSKSYFIGLTMTRSRNTLMYGNNVVLRRVVFDNNYTATYSLYESRIFVMDGDLTIDSCLFQNNYSTTTNTYIYPPFLIRGGVGKTVALRNNVFKNNFHPYFLLDFSDCSGTTQVIDNNIFTGNISTPQSVLIGTSSPNSTAAQNIYIRNNLFYKNRGIAISLVNGINDSAFIINNTITQNAKGIIIRGDYAFYQKIANNIIVNNTDEDVNNQIVGGLYSNFIHHVQFVNNVIGNTVRSNPLSLLQMSGVITSGSTGNFGGSVYFKDTANNDFHLSGSSMAINRGASMNHMPAYDLERNPRPNPVGSSPDIGVYENSNKYSAPFLITPEAGDKTIRLFWNASPSAGLSTYRILRSNSPISDTESTGIIVDTLSIGTLSYKDSSGLSNLTTYYYRIQVRDASGYWSELSNQVSSIPRVPPAAPDTFFANVGPRCLEINWNASASPNVVYYQLYRGTSAGNKVKIADSLSVLKYIDNNLNAGTTYYYSMRAIDNFGTKGYFSSDITPTPNRIWFVGSGGNNGNFGGDAAPLLTITNIINNKAINGDTIILNPGTYGERIYFVGKGLTIASRYLLTHDTSYISSTIIDGSIVSPSTDKGTLVYDDHFSTPLKKLIGLKFTKSRGQLFNARNIYFKRLQIEDNIKDPPTTVQYFMELRDSVTFDSSSIINNKVTSGPWANIPLIGMSGQGIVNFTNNIVRNNFLATTSSYLLIVGGQQYKIENNLLDSNQSAIAILLESQLNKNFIVRNNQITKNYSSHAIWVSSGENDTLWIVNNTIAGNLTGVRLFGWAKQNLRFVNNIIQSNTNDILYDGSAVPNCKAEFKNNIIGITPSSDVFDNVINVGTSIDVTGSVNNLGGFVNFVDTAAGNYKLANNSFSIGKGLNSNYTLPYDLTGRSRPSPAGSNPDIGVYEHASKFAAPVLNKFEAGNRTIELFWQASASANGALKYRILRSLTAIADTATTGSIVDTLHLNTLSWKDSASLNNLTTYYYRMQVGDNSGNWSGLSNQLVCVPRVPPLAPDSFTTMTLSHAVRMNWAASVSTGVSYYQVFRGTTANNKIMIADSVYGLQYTQTNVTPGINYYYSVRAVDVHNTKGIQSATAIGRANQLWYVSVSNGSNSNFGGSTTPMQTIALAVTKCFIGDTIILEPGTYSERIDLSSKQITLGSRYLLSNDTGYISTTAIDGSGVTSNAVLVYDNNTTNNGGNRIIGLRFKRSQGRLFDLKNAVIRKLIIENNATNLPNGETTLIYLRDSFVFDSCLVKDNGWQSQLTRLLWSSNSTTNSLYVRHNRFINNRYDGEVVYLYGGAFPHYAYFLNNVFTKGRTLNGGYSGLYGISAIGTWASTAKPVLSGNLFCGNIGLAFRGSNDSTFIINNTIVNNTAGIFILGQHGGYGSSGYYSLIANNIILNSIGRTIDYNVALSGEISPLKFYNNLIDTINNPRVIDLIPGIGSFDTLGSLNNFGGIFPLFVDSANGDFRLANNSPLINKGINLSRMLPFDMNGVLRPSPIGSNPDLGAFENTNKYTSPTLTTTEAGDKTITLFWNPSPTSGLIAYRLLRSTSPIPDSATTGIIADNINIGITTYKDSGQIANLTTYYYRIQARDASGYWTGLSNQISSIPRIPPAAPSTFNGNNGPRCAMLNWNTSVSTNSYYYQLFRGTTPNNKVKIADSLHVLSYFDNNLIAGTKYYYAIRAVDSFNTKGYFTSDVIIVPNRLWFLANNGNSTNFGGETSPMQQIALTIPLAIDGDTLVLNPGTYPERINLAGRGLVIGSRYLLSNDSTYIPVTRIDGNSIVNTGTLIYDNGTAATSGVKALVGLTITRSKTNAIDLSTAILRRLIIEGNAISTLSSNTALINLYNASTIDSSVIRNHNNTGLDFLLSHYNNVSSQIPFIFSSNRVYNNFSNSACLGLNSSTQGFVRNIRNNLFYNNNGNTNSGVINYVGGGTVVPQKINIQNNLLVKNNRIGVKMAAMSLDSFNITGNTISENRIGIEINANEIAFSRLVNNIIVYNGANPNGNQNIVLTGTPSSPIHKTIFRNNLIGYNPTAHALIAVTNFDYLNIIDSSINIGANPEFVDTTLAALNYSLGSSSILIAKGNTDVHMLSTDISGKPRPSPAGTRPDLGAYENPFGVSSPKLQSINVDSIGMKLTWTADTVNVRHFRVYRDTLPNPTKLLDSVNVNLLSYTDVSVVPQKQYYFRIVSVNKQDFASDFSNELSGRVLGIPTLEVPVNNSLNNPRNIIFKWNKNSFASSYRFQLARSNTFAANQIVKDTITSDTTKLVSSLLYNTNYYWRVRSNDSTATSNWSVVFTLQTQVRPPVLTALSTLSNSITLNWNDSSATNILRYKIYRSTSPNDSLLFDSVSSGNYSYTDNVVSNSTRYFYKVIAVNNQFVASAYSNERSAIPLATTTLLQPSNNSLTNREPKFVWQKYSFATKYRLQLSLNSTFASTTLDTIVNDTFYQVIGNLQPNSFFYWRVQCQDSLGSGNFTQSFGFQTELSVPRISGISTLDKRVTLAWVDSAAINVIRYRIFRSTSPNASILIDSVDYPSTVYNDLNVQNSTLYYYRVQAVNNLLLPSAFSNEKRAIPLDTTSLLVPANNNWDVVLQPKLIWKKYPYATKYRMQIYLDIALGTPLLDTVITDTSYQINSNLLNNRNYFWRVQCIDTLGTSNLTPTFVFQTQVSSPALTTLVTSNQQVKLTWTHTPINNLYGYIILRGSTPTNVLPIDTVASGIFTYTDFNVTNNVTYYYRILALNNQMVASVASNPMAAASYELPTGLLINHGPRRVYLEWNSVNQTGVRYQIHRGLSSGTKTKIGDSLASTNYLDTNVVAGTNYYYSIRCLDALGNLSDFTIDLVATPDRIWYVDGSGNNNNYAGIKAPLQTIASAVLQAKQGDTILLKQGTYNERIQFNGKEVTLGSFFITTAIDSFIHTTIIDGNGLGVLPLVSDNQNKSFTLLGLTIDRALQIAVTSNAVNPNKVTVSNCVIKNSGTSAINGVISLNSGTILNSRIQHCTANNLIVLGSNSGNRGFIDKSILHTNTASNAIVMSNLGTVSNSLFYRNSAASVLTHNTNASASDSSLIAYHNTISNNNADGVQVGGTPVSMIDNNIVVNNTNQLSYIGQTQFANIRFRNNIIPGLASKSIPGTFTVTRQNNIETAASFADSAAGNYNLANYSTGIGKANTLFTSATDIAGNTRPMPFGSFPDVGAYECPFSISSPRLDSLVTNNNRIRLVWTADTANIKYFRIYRDTAANASVLIDSVSTLFKSYTDLNVQPAKRYYYRMISVNRQNVLSGYSNELSGTILTQTTLVSPANHSFFVSRNSQLKWRKNSAAQRYQFQVSADTLFAASIMKDSLTSDTSAWVNDLTQNRNYYWRVRCMDANGASDWTNHYTFQTDFDAVIIDSIVAGNHKNTIYWSYGDTTGIKHFRILRDNFSTPNIIHVTSNTSERIYIDDSLVNNISYQYKIDVVNDSNITGLQSNMKAGTPFNTKPVAVKLADVRLPNQGRRTANNYTFRSFGSFDPDGKIDSVVWFVNFRRIQADTALTYPFRQGTSVISMYVYDNDGAMDSSNALIHISLFEKQMNGAVIAGLSAANENMIYAADDSYTSGTAKMIRMDSLGNENFNHLIVTQQIKTTPSVTHDTSVLITNGPLLNGFNKAGTQLFNTINLGGVTEVTPTIDSMLSRIYVGVSNKNFFAYNYNSGGSLAWSYSCDAPISSSAVITGDRKLIFPDVAGTLYGFDISTGTSQGTPPAPKWKYTTGDSINTSPAVDLAGNIYVGTKTGKVLKLAFDSTGAVNQLWIAPLGSLTSSSPIIDGSGFVYIGCANGNFYKIDPNTGAVKWFFPTGAAIRSTPAISRRSKIYVANEAGLLTVLDTGRNVYWFYKDSSAINANILHINGTTYIGTLGGKVLAFWDKDLISLGKKAAPETEPVWGTFQGNPSRSGTQVYNPKSTIGVLEWQRASSGNNIKVYPNPVSSKLNITSYGEVLEAVNLYDLTGREIKSELTFISGNHLIVDLADQPYGTYTCVIKTNRGIRTKLIVIQ